jgi:hypothetical protein
LRQRKAWQARASLVSTLIVTGGAMATAVIGCGGAADDDAAGTAKLAYNRNCAVPPRAPGKPPAHWQARSTAIGPVYLYRVSQYRHSPPSDFDPLPGTSGKRYSGAKQLVLVRGGPFTLSVASSERKVVSLNYNNVGFDNGFAVPDGTPSVTFSECGIPVTQWPGAFIVAGARCVTLTVHDLAGKLLGRRRIPFGPLKC